MEKDKLGWLDKILIFSLIMLVLSWILEGIFRFLIGFPAWAWFWIILSLVILFYSN